MEVVVCCNTHIDDRGLEAILEMREKVEREKERERREICECLCIFLSIT